MDVVEAVAKGSHRPVHNVADVGVGWDKAAGGGVGLVLGKLVLDRLRDGVLVDVVVLPDEAIRVLDRHFPVQVVAGLVVFHIDHLPARAVEDIRAVGGDHVDAVVEVADCCCSPGRIGWRAPSAPP